MGIPPMCPRIDPPSAPTQMSPAGRCDVVVVFVGGSGSESTALVNPLRCGIRSRTSPRRAGAPPGGGLAGVMRCALDAGESWRAMASLHGCARGLPRAWAACPSGWRVACLQGSSPGAGDLSVRWTTPGQFEAQDRPEGQKSRPRWAGMRRCERVLGLQGSTPYRLVVAGNRGGRTASSHPQPSYPMRDLSLIHI